jgi:protein-disulfide isomerase
MTNSSKMALGVLLCVVLIAIGFAGGYVVRDTQIAPQPTAAIAAAQPSPEPLAAVTSGSAAAPSQPAAAFPTAARPSTDQPNQGWATPSPATTIAGPSFQSSFAVLPTVPAGQAEEVSPLWQDERSDAPVRFDIYLDFDCAYCEQWLETVYPRLLEREDVHVVFHALPLTAAGHAHALESAEIAFCAAEGNWFPQFVSTVAAMGALPDDLSAQIAAKVPEAGGAERLAQCASGKEQLARSAEASAVRSGIGVTPAFVINGRLFIGNAPLETLNVMIEQAKVMAPARMGETTG